MATPQIKEDWFFELTGLSRSDFQADLYTAMRLVDGDLHRLQIFLEDTFEADWLIGQFFGDGQAT